MQYAKVELWDSFGGSLKFGLNCSTGDGDQNKVVGKNSVLKTLIRVLMALAPSRFLKLTYQWSDVIKKGLGNINAPTNKYCGLDSQKCDRAVPRTQ